MDKTILQTVKDELMTDIQYIDRLNQRDKFMLKKSLDKAKTMDQKLDTIAKKVDDLFEDL